MEPLSGEPVFFYDFFIYLIISIDSISDDRISDRCEMDSDLVRASCQEIYLEECVFFVEISLVAKLCFSYFWIERIIGGHLFPIVWIAPDVRLYISLFISYFSYHECEVGFLYSSFRDLELERVHGLIILRDDDESTRILIETMDDARTFNSVDDGWIFVFTVICSYSQTFEMIKKSIHETSFSPIFSRSRMSIHAGIFIYDREVIIFVDDIDREIFGHELHVLDLPLDTHDISPIYLFIFREVRSVAVYLPLFDHLLEIAS